MPEDTTAQHLQAFTNQNNQYRIDPSMQVESAQAENVLHNVEDVFEHGTGMEELLQASFANDGYERQGSEAQTQSIGDQENNIENGTRKKKGAASSAANDMELRRLFRENSERDLHQVALQVLENEKGPKSEKTKQIFGMLWLSKHCLRSKTGSVPRNRVFSSYADGCSTERVPPLNPASFGKLVRIIFPGIQTRRLGIRGESKYHYVELAFVVENTNYTNGVEHERDQSVAIGDQGALPNDRSRHASDSPEISIRPQLPADNTAVFPSPSIPQTVSLPATAKTGMASATLYLRPAFQSDGRSQFSRSNVIYRPLQFQTSDQQGQDGDNPLELPSITPYLPAGIDRDAVRSLTSVYRSHCLLSIDNFRYCKTEKLCDSYKSLIGLLTVPGQKLLAHPQIATWIRECDWLKYQKMTLLLDQTIMTELPKRAMLHIQHVAANLCPWISQYFQNQPRHVQDAMLGPANIFVSLLERYMRVNRACLDVAGVLENVAVRDQLWLDWMSHVNPYHVLQNSLRHRGHNRLLNILTQEVRHLICPSVNTTFVGSGTMFEARDGHSIFDKGGLLHAPSDVDAGAVISRLAAFLRSLPTIFPNVDARQMIMHIDVIGNNIQRNLSLNSAFSLGNWWKIKVFIDEMSSWLAEIGGFQDFGPDSMFESFWPPDIVPTPPGDTETTFEFDGGNDDFEGSRPTTGGDVMMARDNNTGYAAVDAHNAVDITHSHHKAQKETHDTMTELPDTQRDHARRVSNSLDHEAMASLHDDSGIAMGPDDEFGTDGKYGGFVGTVHGSDPADVVVC
ncbi:hypothetical protein MMC13_005565 [Lambiella insularis]|nr:hypothetical protein [Lambiella insularis]